MVMNGDQPDPPPASYGPLKNLLEREDGDSLISNVSRLVLREELIGQIKKMTALENDLEDLRDETRRKQRSQALKLLPLMDSLDRMIRNIGSENEVITSLESLRSQFLGILEDQEVEPIPVEIGMPLDLKLCEVSRQQERSDVQPDLIVQIDRRGYFYQSKVLRRVRVVISTLPQGGKSWE
jgi:molecular chaperone GrpE (heat shock protein)